MIVPFIVSFVIQPTFFILFFVFVTYILPIFSFFMYCIGATDNPWTKNAELINYILQTKLININKVKTPFITNGVILTNHRTFADFYLDPYLFSCPAISRRLAGLASGIFYILSAFFNRTITINRNKDRNKTYSYILSKGKKLFYFYPEGTRCSHIVQPENYKDVALKPGLLKSIWENNDNTRIQITISKNKENVMNEKIFHLGFGVNVYYVTGEPVYTRDYDTFELFFDKIKLDWHTLWNEVYSYEDKEEDKYDGVIFNEICSIS